eukprot:2475609-Pleurochrysis_carterae.AAC.1
MRLACTKQLDDHESVLEPANHRIAALTHLRHASVAPCNDERARQIVSLDPDLSCFGMQQIELDIAVT